MQDLFKKLMGSHTTGVNIVTTMCDKKDYGLTSNSLNAISLSPPIIAFTIRLESGLYHFFSKANHFGISILSEKQEKIARIFSSPQSMNNRFSTVESVRDKNDCLLIKHSLATIESTKESQHIMGDHLVIYSLVTGGSVYEGKPLTYFRKNYTTICAEPIAAKTPADFISVILSRETHET